MLIPAGTIFYDHPNQQYQVVVGHTDGAEMCSVSQCDRRGERRRPPFDRPANEILKALATTSTKLVVVRRVRSVG